MLLVPVRAAKFREAFEPPTNCPIPKIISVKRKGITRTSRKLPGYLV
jgi:hypothetical protein